MKLVNTAIHKTSHFDALHWIQLQFNGGSDMLFDVMKSADLSIKITRTGCEKILENFSSMCFFIPQSSEKWERMETL